MSVLDAVARVNQIAALTSAPASPAPQAPPAAPTGFGAALDTALAAPPAGAGSSVPYGDEIRAAAQRNGVDPSLLAALVKQESGFDPSATSGAGAAGLTQLMPSTAAGLGVSDPYNPAQSLEGGARYLRAQLDRFGGDPALALAAYNAGPGAVTRYGGVPPYAETQRYVRNVLASAQELQP